MKSLLLAFLLICTVVYGASTTTKIKKSKQTLSQTVSEKTKTNRRLGKIAKDIKSAESDIVYLENKLDKLKFNQIKTEKKYALLKDELSTFEKDVESTSIALEKKRKTFISLLSNQFSIVFAMEQTHEATQESVMLHEVYHAYKKTKH